MDVLADPVWHALTGETPMLHVRADNTSAIACYEKLGFAARRTLDVTVVVAPT